MTEKNTKHEKNHKSQMKHKLLRLKATKNFTFNLTFLKD